MRILAALLTMGIVLLKLLRRPFAGALVLLAIAFSPMTSRVRALPVSRTLGLAVLWIPTIVLSMASIRRMPGRRLISLWSLLVVPVHAVLPVAPALRAMNIVAFHHTPACRAFPSRSLHRRHRKSNTAKKSRVSRVMLIQSVPDTPKTS